MPDLSLVILYVDDPTASAAFYADLLGQPPAEQSPTFAMFCSATITVSAGASIRMSASGGFSIRLLWPIVNGNVGVQSLPKPRGGSTACRSARSMSQMACNASAVVVSRRLSGSVSNQAA